MANMGHHEHAMLYNDHHFSSLIAHENFRVLEVSIKKFTNFHPFHAVFQKTFGFKELHVVKVTVCQMQKAAKVRKAKLSFWSFFKRK